MRLMPLLQLSSRSSRSLPTAVRSGKAMCYAQIGGLTAATFITLLLVPVIYAIAVLDLKVVKWNQSGEESRCARNSSLSPLLLAALPLGGALRRLSSYRLAVAKKNHTRQRTIKVGRSVQSDHVRCCVTVDEDAKPRKHHLL